MSESTMNLMWCEIPTSGNRYKLLRLIEEFTLNFERRTWMNGVTWVDGRKTTSTTFSSISAGIFNYSFSCFVPRSHFSFSFTRFHICSVAVWKTGDDVKRMKHEQDEWDIYFKTTTVFVICDFVAEKYRKKMLARASNDVRWKAHRLCSFSHVGGENWRLQSCIRAWNMQCIERARSGLLSYRQT